MLSMGKERVILVTGANKGIGFEVVKTLASTHNDLILLGCRDLERGHEAAVRLGSPPNVHLLHLDVSSRDHIIEAVDKIKYTYGGALNIIINNAAIGELEMNKTVARKMFTTNYYGMKVLNELLFPIMKENGRMINVASMCGSVLLSEVSLELQQKYLSPTCTIEQLDNIVEEFISAVDTNSLEDLGYNPKSSYLIYSATKAAVLALTQIEARQWSKLKNLLIVSVCPGFCDTDLNRNALGARPAHLGADSILSVVNATDDELKNGCFYRDGQQQPLVHVNGCQDR